jgi:hypothetical protein
MGKCVICHETFISMEEIDFIEMSSRNDLGEMTSGIAVHPWCKEEWFKLQQQEREKKGT